VRRHLVLGKPEATQGSFQSVFRERPATRAGAREQQQSIAGYWVEASESNQRLDAIAGTRDGAGAFSFRGGNCPNRLVEIEFRPNHAAQLIWSYEGQCQQLETAPDLEHSCVAVDRQHEDPKVRQRPLDGELLGIGSRP
jgi:hypothetical protein